MAKKKIQRARCTRKQKSAVEEFIGLGFAFHNKDKLEFRGHDSLWFALIAYNTYKYSASGIFKYMDRCMEYDRIHKNLKRIKAWEELKSHNLSAEEILDFGEEEYKLQYKKLMADVKQQIEKENA